MNSPFYIKWTARIIAILLFLFWGGFFLEHLAEWFLEAEKGLPPVKVWFAVFFHLIMILGFLIMIRWQKTGILTMLAASIVFFLILDLNRFPYIALINLLPVPFFIISSFLENKVKKHKFSDSGE